jgi:hypothetical protein
MRKKKEEEDVPEKDANLDEDKSNETEEEVKVEGESSKSISFREWMRGMTPHHLPLKDRKKGNTISYMDLLRPGPPPSELSMKYAKRK